jgi:hypothetical protein
MADAITTAIETDATAGVLKAAVDGQTVEMMPIADRILAAEYVAKKTAASKNHLGLTFRKFEPQD